ncbi:MAG: helicase-related protein [Methanobacterium sp.]
MFLGEPIIDNSEGNKLSNFLNLALKESQGTRFDIATAFFNIQAFAMIKDNLSGVESFRLLLGKAPDIHNDVTLGDLLLKTIKEEIEGFNLSKETDEAVKVFMDFLKKNSVQIRLFEDFLHGKAYIFDNLMVMGSSNFTAAGLTRYGELNTWTQKPQAVYARSEWFDKFWEQSIEFKIELLEILEASRFGSREYTPYEIYIKSLYELQKDDILPPGTDNDDESYVNLAEFQEDAIYRVISRLNKYGGVIVADSVGLGKTHIALKVIENFHLQSRKKRALVICPAQIRDLVWRKELKEKILPEYVISQEEIGADNYLEKVKAAVADKLDEIELIVVDESHNFRNPLSKRWEHLFELINDHISKEGKKPKLLFLTATPINNSPWDLYWQVMLLVSMNRSAFLKENIQDLFDFFKKVDSDPAILNDLLNEISIRRTRNYIVKNYPNAYIGSDPTKKIVFPERILKNIDYELDKTYKGMYKEISDIISDKLTMAYYRMLEYRIDGVTTEKERLELGRMISIGGIFRTILLKRLESSVESFRISIKRQIDFLEKLKGALESGKIIRKSDFAKLLSKFESVTTEDIEDYLDKFESLEGVELSPFKKENYRYEELFEDIDTDVELLKRILDMVRQISPEEDSKLNVLKDKLLELSKEGQILLFAYYADTLNYIYDEIIKDNRFNKLNIKAISSSGLTSKNPSQRENIVKKFTDGEIEILLSTDVLSEGQNLQSAKYLINYDLHWNPTRMVQRAGRIDRIGSPYEEICIYNFFPENELEELLRLINILQKKISNINDSLGLDGSILGEKIKPKVFGIIRAIKEEDEGVFEKLEDDTFAGGEMFYQPLKDFMREKAIEEIENIPYGVHSGLNKGSFAAIFLYYKYDDDFHYWYLYDVNGGEIITHKSEIYEFISCESNEVRFIPDFFDTVYKVNNTVLNDIEMNYKRIEQKTKDSKLKEWNTSNSTKFLKKMLDVLDYEVGEHMIEYPADEDLEKNWYDIQEGLIYTPLTKKRLQILRKIWKQHNKHYNWKKTLHELDNFLEDKSTLDKSPIEPFDKSKLQLVTIDFIS